MLVKCAVFKLTSHQNALHERALELSRKHRQIEFQLVEVLQQIDRDKLFRAFECTSLFKYAVEVLELTEAVALAFISVARAAQKVAVLQETLRAQSLSVRKVSRMVSFESRECSRND